MSDAKKPGPCPHCARPIGVEYVEVEPGKCQLWRWMVEVGSNTPGTPAPRTVSDCFGHTSRRIRELEAKVADLDAQAKAARKALARRLVPPLEGALAVSRARLPEQGATDPMTDDTLDHLARDVRRIAIKGEPTARDTRTLADALGVALEALAEARRGLRETRHLVDALVGGVRVEGPVTYTYRGLDDGMYTAKRAGAVTHTVTQHDPCPLAGQAGHECRWQLGVRACVGGEPKPP